MIPNRNHQQSITPYLEGVVLGCLILVDFSMMALMGQKYFIDPYLLIEIASLNILAVGWILIIGRKKAS